MTFNDLTGGTPATAADVMENFRDDNYGADVIPKDTDGLAVDDTLNIGSLTQRFKDGHFSGTLTASGQVRAKVKKSGDQSSGGDFTVTWNLEDYDIGDSHDNTTNNERLTAPIAGTYLCTTAISYLISGVTVGELEYRIERFNSADVFKETVAIWRTANINQTEIVDKITISGISDFAISDYIVVKSDEESIDSSTVRFEDSFLSYVKLN